MLSKEDLRNVERSTQRGFWKFWWKSTLISVVIAVVFYGILYLRCKFNGALAKLKKAYNRIVYDE